ncbi:MAG: hypothetical protein LBJ11_08260 [Oscillospiraceae bacterium]|jgi:hypothetical protein|nr:hypothetical protein [Oscillospiraceae bacterium]
MLSFLRALWLRALALLVAPLCLLTTWITDGKDQPIDGQYPAVSQENFGLFGAVPRYQGITTDGEYWYYSWNFGLYKTTLDHKPVENNFIAIPLKYLTEGSNHIGGISVAGGKLYCPLEDGGDYLHPYILIYDAETLRWTGKAYALPQELHVKGVPWVAVDVPRGVAYTAEWNNATVLNVFSLEDFTLLRTVPLSAPIDRVQGAEVYGGVLYCAADSKDSHTIWAVQPETGEVYKAFDRNLDNAIEAEDATVWPMPDGSLIHCIETGSSRVNVVLKHYAFDPTALPF